MCRSKLEHPPNGLRCGKKGKGGSSSSKASLARQSALKASVTTLHREPSHHEQWLGTARGQRIVDEANRRDKVPQRRVQVVRSGSGPIVPQRRAQRHRAGGAVAPAAKGLNKKVQQAAAATRLNERVQRAAASSALRQPPTSAAKSHPIDRLEASAKQLVEALGYRYVDAASVEEHHGLTTDPGVMGLVSYDEMQNFVLIGTKPDGHVDRPVSKEFLSVEELTAVVEAHLALVDGAANPKRVKRKGGKKAKPAPVPTTPTVEERHKRLAGPPPSAAVRRP